MEHRGLQIRWASNLRLKRGPIANAYRRLESGMKSVVLSVIRLYQMTLSRILPPTCRFEPSCSQYGYEAIARYGVWRGSWLAIKRIARCHPFNPGGYDPVPNLDDEE